MPDPSSASPATDRPHRLFSRVYAAASERMELVGMSELRTELLTALGGDVVEIGAGNGMNFGHYPPAVTSVLAVEPEPHLRRLATQAAQAAPAPVTVRPGTAEALPLADRSVDAAVLCLVMCSLPDRTAALAEVRRVLRPGGVLRFLEHTVAGTAGLRRVQRIADATVWPLLTGGCHTATDPLAAIEAAGLTITDVRRLRFPEHRFSQPSSPHVLGGARTPV